MLRTATQYQILPKRLKVFDEKVGKALRIAPNLFVGRIYCPISPMRDSVYVGLVHEGHSVCRVRAYRDERKANHDVRTSPCAAIDVALGQP